jgi:ureidoacrylate peracid hydrolase
MLKTLAQKIDPKHAALLIVDMQNDFCHSDGFSGKAGREMASRQAMAPRLANLLDEARRHQVRVVFIRQVNTDYVLSEVALEQKRRQAKVGDQIICREGSWGADFFAVSPLPGEPVINKHRYSAFIDTDLDLILRSLKIRTLIMTGVATNMCVESTARDGFMKDYYIVFVADCTATSSKEDHEATLRNIQVGFGEVANAKDLIADWNKRP